MSFNFVDGAALAYVGYGAWRGLRRGFAMELPGVISWALALCTGSGLYRWTERGLCQFNEVTGRSLGSLGFVMVLAGSYGIVKKLRAHIRQTAERRMSEEMAHTHWGMVAGGCRALFLGSSVILFLSLAPIGFLRGPFSHGSFLGRNLTRFVRPVHEMVHRKESEPEHPSQSSTTTSTVPDNARSKTY